MFADLLAALGLLICLLWLVHTWLPAGRQERVNQQLRRTRHGVQQGLQQLRDQLRARRGGRQAHEQAQALIERARRDATGSGSRSGQVHDLARFRRQRQADRDGPDRLH